MNVDTRVTLAGVSLKNPIIAASGTFGYGREYSEYYDISRLGAISVKGLTLRPREGNPPPRVAETPMGMLNSVGLQNPGAEAFLQKELPFLRTKDIVVIANISADSPEEYGDLAALLGSEVDMLEVNISCPNVKSGGLAFGAEPKAAAAVTAAVKRRARVPVCVKLSPNVSDIAAIGKACEEAGADVLSLINTLLGMRIDIEHRKPVLGVGKGGLSGPAVFPVALRCVWQVRETVKIPLIGMGGIASGRDAVEMLMAGASALGVGTATLRDPYAPLKILEELLRWCREHEIGELCQIRMC